MTHRSAAQGKAAEWSNERLEFLGDRMLGLVMVETLMERFPKLREGELAPRLNAMVSRETCADRRRRARPRPVSHRRPVRARHRRTGEALAARQRHRSRDRRDLHRWRAGEGAQVHPQARGRSCCRPATEIAARSQIRAAGMGAGRGHADARLSPHLARGAGPRPGLYRHRRRSTATSPFRRRQFETAGRARGRARHARRDRRST